jgi:thioredoxin 1
MVKIILDSNFEQSVLASDKPVVVDFFAEWCGPCRLLTSMIEEMSKAFEGKVEICKINVDDNPEVSKQYSIRSIPTLLFFKNGELVDKHVGVITKVDLEKKIKAIL